MSSIQTVWEFVRRHKYFVVITFFALMMGFVDENSFFDRYQRIQEINALKSEMRAYQNHYERDTKMLEELRTKPEAVVRVAREQYLMKYSGEDVYVFMDDTRQEQNVEEADGTSL